MPCSCLRLPSNGIDLHVCKGVDHFIKSEAHPALITCMHIVGSQKRTVASLIVATTICNTDHTALHLMPVSCESVTTFCL